MKRELKILFLILLCAALGLFAAGCAKEEEETGYMVYYGNASGTRLMETGYHPSAGTFDEMMQEMMGQLAAAPVGYVSALPESVKFIGYERGIDALRVDFSDGYYDLNNTEEVLLRAAVVKTLCQIPGVTKVMITVNGEQARDSEGDLIPSMDADTFIDTKEGGINSYQYATLDLYFASADGSRIERETRNLHYSSNMVLERVVVEQLIRGPENSDLEPVLASGTKLQNIYTQNGICTISFDEKCNEVPSESSVEAEAALYAIVNSICRTCDGIKGVKFEIEGENDRYFRDEVDLDQIFRMNENIIETEELQTEMMTSETAETAEAEETAETGNSDGAISGTVVSMDDADDSESTESSEGTEGSDSTDGIFGTNSLTGE